MTILPIILLVAVPYCIVSSVESQAADAATRIKFTLEVDCDRPFSFHNYPVNSEMDGFLSSEQKAYADLTMFTLNSPRIHFEAQMGGVPSPAPGGYASLKILHNNFYRTVWDLPNNQFLLDIDLQKNLCNAKLSIKLRPGKREYSIYDGLIMYYCSRVDIKNISCEKNIK
jgi:hypothetical protein